MISATAAATRNMERRLRRTRPAVTSSTSRSSTCGPGCPGTYRTAGAPRDSETRASTGSRPHELVEPGGAQVAAGQVRLEGGRLGVVENTEEVRTGGVVPGRVDGGAGAGGTVGAGGSGEAVGAGRPESEGLPLVVVVHAVIPLSSSASFIERSA